MQDQYRLSSWFIDNWARLALPSAALLLILVPVLWTDDARSLILLSTLLPVYMIHQYEEHADGRFVEFFNATVGQGHNVLTKVSAFWINILGVWLVFLVSFYLTKYVTAGVALVAIYLTLVSAVIHVMTTVRLHRYNPGLYTSVLLVLPWGCFLLVFFNHRTRSALLFNGIGLFVAFLIHAIIVVYALSKRRQLIPASEPRPPR